MKFTKLLLVVSALSMLFTGALMVAAQPTAVTPSSTPVKLIAIPWSPFPAGTTPTSTPIPQETTGRMVLMDPLLFPEDAVRAPEDHPLWDSPSGERCRKGVDALMIVRSNQEDRPVGCGYLIPELKSMLPDPSVKEERLPGGGFRYSSNVSTGVISRAELDAEEAAMKAKHAQGIREMGGRILPPVTYPDNFEEKLYGRRKFKRMKRFGTLEKPKLPGRVYVPGDSRPIPEQPPLTGEAKAQHERALKTAHDIPTPLTPEEVKAGVTIPEEFYNQK
jgi:hypothetical protein